MSLWLSAHAAFAYFALMMTFFSLWIKRSAWIWGSLLIFACAFAFFAGILQPIAFLPIGSLFILHAFVKFSSPIARLPKLLHWIGISVIFLVSIGLSTHFFAGFHNVELLKEISISPNSSPFTWFLNFDTPFIGIFVLAFGFPLIKDRVTLMDVSKRSLPFIFFALLFMIYLALYLGVIRWDPKLPSFFWLFALQNLFLVSIVEEAFWRGFIQKELYHLFGNHKLIAAPFSIFLTSALFALLHYRYIHDPSFLLLVFIAAIFYGALFQLTKALETSIFCHWLFNVVHFLFFTYPMLQK